MQRNRRGKQKPNGASLRAAPQQAGNGSDQEKSADPLNDLLERSKDDPGAPFEAEEISLSPGAWLERSQRISSGSGRG